MVLCALPVQASAETLYEEHTFYYTIDSGEVTVTRADKDSCPVNEEGAYLVIPDEIEGCPVTAIADNAFIGWGALYSITLPDTLQTIGRYAFKDCTRLKKIEIPDSIRQIKDFAFSGCTRLRHVAIGTPSEVQADHYATIGDAFYQCEGFETLSLGNVVRQWDINQTPRHLYEQIRVGKYVDLYASEDMGINEACVIYGYTGSAAEAYATSAQLRFVALDETRMELLSCNPEMGGEYTELNHLELTFNVVPSNQLSGCIYIKDYDTDETVLTLDNSYQSKIITGTDGKTLRFAGALSRLKPGKYYILIDSTAITTVGLTQGNVLLGYPGITKKDAYTFCLTGSEAYFPIHTSMEKGNLAASVSAVWNDSWFLKDASQYNHALATTCAALSGAAYQESYLTEAFEGLDFDSWQLYFYDGFNGEDYDVVCYGFAAKKLANQDKTVIVVAVRGTPNNEEWYSNFNIGLSDTHAGFQSAAQRLMEDFKSYYAQTGLSPNETKIVVTGHSRGAAVANLVAYDMMNRYAPASDVYAYTFATPTVSTKTGKANCPNIFNIISGEDFVTQVPLGAWGFGHYGTDLLLPSRTYYGAQYDGIYEKMAKKFALHAAVDFAPYPNGSAAVSDVVDYVFGLAGDHLDFYAVPHATADQTLHSYFLKISDMLIDGGSKFWEIMGIAGESVSPFYRITMFFYANHVAQPRILSAHSALTYYCWMSSCSAEELFGNANSETRKTYSKLTVACPVDVYVYDENGTLVASVVDETPQTQTLAISVDEGVKTVYLPDDQDYSVKVIARESCTVDYAVEENAITATAGQTNRTMDAQDIAMEQGETLKAEIETSGNGAAEQFNLDQYTSDGQYKREVKVKASGVNPFTDVKQTSFYYEPVIWALDCGITNGVTPTTFAPAEPCNRGQVVTFLWRAAGCPEPASDENPFTDVKEGKFYYKAVLWAVEEGITNGMGNGRFAPGDPCTRAQVATFLWRALGKPDAESSAAAFSDVVPGSFYCDAVAWAVEKGITNGMGNGKFQPGSSCTRGQIVTFLYRAYC